MLVVQDETCGGWRRSGMPASPGCPEAAVYTSGSPREVNMTAYVKGLILQIHLEGPAARAKKDQAIALLKTAAARL
jgi:hypothetical protein